MPPDERAPSSDALTILHLGAVDVRGRMPWSSNATFLVELCHDGATMPAIYKPHRGERPLWDFPDGLHRREVAAYRLSEALGWGLVPETIVREDAPLGPGSLQRFVPADFSEHYFTLLERPEHGDALTELGILYAPDFVINAGGVINVADELIGYDRDRAMAKVEGIYRTLREVFRLARTEGITPGAAANQIAEERIADVSRIRLLWLPAHQRPSAGR